MEVPLFRQNYWQIDYGTTERLEFKRVFPNGILDLSPAELGRNWGQHGPKIDKYLSGELIEHFRFHSFDPYIDRRSYGICGHINNQPFRLEWKTKHKNGKLLEKKTISTPRHGLLGGIQDKVFGLRTINNEVYEAIPIFCGMILHWKQHPAVSEKMKEILHYFGYAIKPFQFQEFSLPRALHDPNYLNKQELESYAWYP